MRRLSGLVALAIAGVLVVMVMGMCEAREYVIVQADGSRHVVSQQYFEAYAARAGNSGPARTVGIGGRGGSSAAGQPPCPSGDCPSGDCPTDQYQIEWQNTPRWQNTPITPEQLPSLGLPPVPAEKVNPAVCRVQAAGGYGSGTLIEVTDGRGLVVTCKHLEGKTPVECIFPNGRKLKGEWVVDKNANDLAAVMIGDPGVREIEVFADGPKVGQAAWSMGYEGQTGRFQVNRGSVSRVQGNLFWLSGRAHGGNSGGPVLDTQGRLIGILWGTTTKKGLRMGHPQEVFATSSVAADAFLTRAGRYFLSPYRGRVDRNMQGMNQRIGNLEQQPPPVIPFPPQQLPPCPVVDLTPINTRVDLLEGRVDGIVEAAEKISEEVGDELPKLNAAYIKARDEAIAARAEAEKAAKATDKKIEEVKKEGAEGAREHVKAAVGNLFQTYGWPIGGLLGFGGFLIWRRIQTGERVTARLRKRLAGIRQRIGDRINPDEEEEDEEADA